MPDPVVDTPPIPPVDTPPAPPTPSWRDTLPDDLKADKTLAETPDVPTLARRFLETKKMVGAKTEGLVKVPGADAKPEDVAAFHKALGVPDAPTGYTYKRPQLAAVMGWNEQAANGFLADAHKAGFTPTQVQTAIDYFGRMQQAQHDADRQTEREAGVALRTEWGANFDAQVGLANRALSQYGGDALVEYLHTSKLGADPRMVKAWAAVGRDLVEGGYVKGEGLSGVSVEEAQGKIREIDAELMKLEPNSARAKELTEQKYRYLAVR